MVAVIVIVIVVLMDSSSGRIISRSRNQLFERSTKYKLPVTITIIAQV